MCRQTGDHLLGAVDNLLVVLANERQRSLDHTGDVGILVQDMEVVVRRDAVDASITGGFWLARHGRCVCVRLKIMHDYKNKQASVRTSNYQQK
jgi:hypothetical protein